MLISRWCSLSSVTVERAKSDAPAHVALVRHSITAILTRGRTHSDLPASYEKIYNSCRFVVCHTDDGVNVYSKLKIELESLVGRLAKELTESGEEAVSWISQFVEVCQWFETQVVSTHIRLMLQTLQLSMITL